VIPRFSLARPRSLSDAFEAFDASGGDAAWLAGGTELLQVMKMGLAQFGTLIDIKAIADLRGLQRTDDGRLRIGALTTHRELERSPLIAEELPGLSALEARVANVRVRNTGTIGGNLAFAEPHSDPATFLLACDATVRLVGPRGRREMGVGEFVQGPLSTARDPDELVLDVVVPRRAPSTGRAYEKIAFFERPAASVAVRLAVVDGTIGEATVAVGSLTEVPTLVPEAAAAFRGSEARPEALAEPVRTALEAFGGLDVIADLNGSQDYKRHLAGILLGRAAEGALTEAVAHA
jgi:aerobic carbon-monoxide dehydrogenase medium subunit